MKDIATKLIFILTVSMMLLVSFGASAETAPEFCKTYINNVHPSEKSCVQNLCQSHCSINTHLLVCQTKMNSALSTCAEKSK